MQRNEAQFRSRTKSSKAIKVSTTKKEQRFELETSAGLAVADYRRTALLFIHGWAIAITQSHAAEPDHRDFKVAFAEKALFIVFFPYELQACLRLRCLGHFGARSPWRAW
jgi:hypothetical protein